MSKADLDKLVAKLPSAIVSTHSRLGDDTAVVLNGHFLEVMTWLKEGLGYDFLADVTAVDWLGQDLRFEAGEGPRLSTVTTEDDFAALDTLPDFTPPEKKKAPQGGAFAGASRITWPWPCRTLSTSTLKTWLHSRLLARS